MQDKIDYKKVLKELYGQSPRKISIVKVPRLNYLVIEGEGNPNTSKEYKDAVEALFKLSYKIKFMIKRSELSIDYGVMPLEGLWWSGDMKDFAMEKKDKWKWAAMIMQPAIVTRAHVTNIIEEEAGKKELSAISKVIYKEYEEGLAAQMMHIGPYGQEGQSIERLHSFIKEAGYQLSGFHHEIYLSDPRRCEPGKMKTILRQPIRRLF